MNPSIALIGPGKVGCAIAQRLYRAGYPMVAVVSRQQEKAADACSFIGCSAALAGSNLAAAYQAEIILLAVPDDEIGKQADRLAQNPQRLVGRTLIHFSGLHPATVMRNKNFSATVLSIHPLLPFANRQLASEKLTGCPCALEGDQESLALGRQLIEAFAGRPFHIAPEKKALYHSSACIASNFFVTLMATASELLADCEVPAEQTLAMLTPLVQATVNNLATLGAEQGLTGPIVRGDLGTVKKHLAALENYPQMQKTYRLLGCQTVALAEKSTRLSAQRAAQLLKILNPVGN